LDNFSKSSQVTIIPARGGSKGIKAKNVQEVNGITLVERAIKSAQKIKENLIIVSSDDKKILNLARTSNVISHQRSEINSSDSASSESVVLEILNDYNLRDVIVTLLQVTSPFIDVKAWQQSIDKLKERDDLGSIFSASIKNVFQWEFTNRWSPINHSKYFRELRQNRSLGATETGAFYIFKSELFKAEQTRFCGITEPVETSIWSSFDIDTLEDLEFCQKIGSIFDSEFDSDVI